ncbi:MAG: cell division protein ZapE, partial [Brachybacterium sp.]|nr:cell division protein ZapE [Brachybacterium sp.]
HPSRYGALIDEVSAAPLTGMHGLTHHHDALRFVVLVDRLYDREVPALVSLAGAAAPGVLDDLFSEELLRSGYRKKYLRSLSRLASITNDGGALLRPGAADAAS